MFVTDPKCNKRVFILCFDMLNVLLILELILKCLASLLRPFVVWDPIGQLLVLMFYFISLILTGRFQVLFLYSHCIIYGSILVALFSDD